MPMSSSPPHLPADSPGSSVSSRFQNEYNELIRRAVVLSNNGLTAKLTMNPTVFGPGPRAVNGKHVLETDLIDLSSPNTHRTDVSQSDIETQRQQLSQIPSLHQILASTSLPAGNQQHAEHRLASVDCDDPLAHHLVRYSDLMSNELESKPITEKMDHWYLDLKKNLMNEFDKLRLQFLEEAQQQALHEKQAQAKEFIRLNQDIKAMRDMLTHYEQTLDQKDQTEKNLNKALNLLNDRTIAHRRYYEWRLVHIERRRQDYALALAKRFYDDKMKRRALISWKGVVEREWKKRFEVACEKKAKDVLMELGDEYESKYQRLQSELRNANEEIARLRADHGDHDEGLKKAFMRGVCALNMEAMSVLLKNQHGTEPSEEQSRRSLLHSKSADDQFTDEGIPTSVSSTAGDDESSSKPSSSSYQHVFPAHVYKECFPSTIYRTGEARPIRSANTNTHPRHVTFHKRPSSAGPWKC